MNALKSRRALPWALIACTATSTLSPMARAAVPRPSVRAASRAAPDVHTLKKELRRAIDAVNEDPDVATEQLRNALDAAAAAPGVMARDPDAHGLRIEGLLTLARAYLVLDARPRAERVIDEAIRISRGDIPPIEEFGPSLATLYNDRVAAPELRPAGSVHVSCETACRVILDGRVAGTGVDLVVTGIPLGDHLIRMEPRQRSVEHFEQRTFTITDGDRAQEFSYAPPQAPAVPSTTQPPTDDPGSGRKLPRWASILGMSVGAAMVIGGIVLVVVDGKCPDGEDPMGDNACREVLQSKTGGIVTAAIGGAALVGFSVTLGVGETKDKKHKQTQSAVVGVRFRF